MADNEQNTPKSLPKASKKQVKACADKAQALFGVPEDKFKEIAQARYESLLQYFEDNPDSLLNEELAEARSSEYFDVSDSTEDRGVVDWERIGNQKPAPEARDSEEEDIESGANPLSTIDWKETFLASSPEFKAKYVLAKELYELPKLMESARESIDKGYKIRAQCAAEKWQNQLGVPEDSFDAHMEEQARSCLEEFTVEEDAAIDNDVAMLQGKCFTKAAGVEKWQGVDEWMQLFRYASAEDKTQLVMQSQIEWQDKLREELCKTLDAGNHKLLNPLLKKAHDHFGVPQAIFRAANDRHLEKNKKLFEKKPTEPLGVDILTADGKPFLSEEQAHWSGAKDWLRLVNHTAPEKKALLKVRAELVDETRKLEDIYALYVEKLEDCPKFADFTNEKIYRKHNFSLWGDLNGLRAKTYNDLKYNKKSSKILSEWMRDEKNIFQLHVHKENHILAREAKKRIKEFRALYKEENQATAATFDFIEDELEAKIKDHLRILTRGTSPNAETLEKGHYKEISERYSFLIKDSLSELNSKGLITTAGDYKAHINDIGRLTEVSPLIHKTNKDFIKGIKNIVSAISHRLQAGQTKEATRKRLLRRFSKIELEGTLERHFGDTEIKIHPLHLDGIMPAISKIVWKFDDWNPSEEDIRAVGNAVVDTLEEKLAYERTQKAKRHYQQNRRISNSEYYQRAERRERRQRQFNDPERIKLDDTMRLGGLDSEIATVGGVMLAGGTIASIIAGGNSKDKDGYQEVIKKKKSKKAAKEDEQDDEVVVETKRPSGIKVAFKRVGQVAAAIGTAVLIDGFVNEGRATKATVNFIKDIINGKNSDRGSSFGFFK